MPSVSVLREITHLMEREVAFTRKTFGKDFGAPPVPRCFLRLIEAWGGLAVFRAQTGCDLVLLPFPWAHTAKAKWWDMFTELKTGEDMALAWGQEFPSFPGPGAWYWSQCFGHDEMREMNNHFPSREESETSEWVLTETIPTPHDTDVYLNPRAMVQILREIGGRDVVARVNLPFFAEPPHLSIRRILQLIPKAVLQHWFYEKRSTGSVTAHLPTGWEATYLDFWREEHLRQRSHASLVRSAVGEPEIRSSDPSPLHTSIWEWCSDVGNRFLRNPLSDPSSERLAIVFGGRVDGIGVHQAVSVTESSPSIGWRLVLRAVE